MAHRLNQATRGVGIEKEREEERRGEEMRREKRERERGVGGVESGQVYQERS